MSAGGIGRNVTASTTTAGNISVGSVSAAGDQVSLTAVGAITDANGATNNVTASSLTATAGTGINLDTTITTLTAANVTGTGAIDIRNSGALTVTSATTTDGAITLAADNGTLTLTTVTAGGIGRNVTASTTTAGNIAVGSVSAAGDQVSLTAVGAITDANGTANNVTASSLAATAGTGIDLDTTVTTLTSANVTGTGSIDISNTGALAVANATTANGNITLNATGGNLAITTVTAAGPGADVSLSTTTSGNIVLGVVTAPDVVTLNAADAIIDANGAANNVTASSLTATAGTGINLDTTITTLTSANVTGAGAIDIRNAGALAVTSATTNDGAITLAADNGTLTLTSVSAGGIGRNVTASTTTVGDIAVGSVSAAGDQVSLTAVGSITDANGVANNVTASSLTATAGTGINLDTTITTLSSANVTGLGAIDIRNSGALTVTSATTNDGAIILAADNGTLTLTTVSAGGIGRDVTASTTTAGNIAVGSVSARSPTRTGRRTT